MTREIRGTWLQRRWQCLLMSEATRSDTHEQNDSLHSGQLSKNEYTTRTAGETSLVRQVHSISANPLTHCPQAARCMSRSADLAARNKHSLRVWDNRCASFRVRMWRIARLFVLRLKGQVKSLAPCTYMAKHSWTVTTIKIILVINTYQEDGNADPLHHVSLFVSRALSPVDAL